MQRRELREVELGDWERGEFRRRAAANDPQFAAFAQAGRWDLVPNSEGDGPFRSRVHTAVEDIIAAHTEGQTVAIVCHGGVINGYLAEHYGMHSSFVASIENTSITMIRAVGDRRSIVVINDAHHLYDPVVGAGT